MKDRTVCELFKKKDALIIGHGSFDQRCSMAVLNQNNVEQIERVLYALAYQGYHLKIDKHSSISMTVVSIAKDEERYSSRNRSARNKRAAAISIYVESVFNNAYINRTDTEVSYKEIS